MSDAASFDSRTPEWLLRGEPALCPCGCIGRRNRSGYLAKTLAGTSAMLQHAMSTEELASRPGLLQRIDPRAKVVAAIVLLVATSLARQLGLVVLVVFGAVVLARVSAIPVRGFIMRVWCFVPIFTGIVVAPATLNVVTRGRIVVPFGTWFGHELGMTSSGLTSAALIVARVAASVSTVLLVTTTTPWARLLAALRSLRVPAVFVMVVAMAYRYIFHLLAAVTDMYTARKARLVGAELETVERRAFVAATAGALFGKAHALSEEVHLAMVSRGFTGEVHVAVSERLRAHDWLIIVCATLVAALLLIGDHVLR